MLNQQVKNYYFKQEVLLFIGISAGGPVLLVEHISYAFGPSSLHAPAEAIIITTFLFPCF